MAQIAETQPNKNEEARKEKTSMALTYHGNQGWQGAIRHFPEMNRIADPKSSHLLGW